MVIFARDSLMHEDLADIILFAALSGIRQNRILALKANDINFEGSMIRVLKPKSRSVKERWCGLHPTLRTMLERRCTEQGRLRLFGDDWIPSSYDLNLILIMMTMLTTKLLLIKCVEHLEDAYVTSTE